MSTTDIDYSFADLLVKLLQKKGNNVINFIPVSGAAILSYIYLYIYLYLLTMYLKNQFLFQFMYSIYYLKHNSQC